MIQFKENAQADRKTDGRMDRPYFIGPFPLLPEVQKSNHIFETSKV